MGLVEKPTSPGRRRTWRQWLPARRRHGVQPPEAFGVRTVVVSRAVGCGPGAFQKRALDESSPPLAIALRGRTLAQCRPHIPDAWRVIRFRHYRLMRSLCLQFGDADALEATREWGPKVDDVLPQTVPNDRAF